MAYLWEDAFPIPPYQPKPPGNLKMLYLVAYDITEPRRLKRIANICLDYGVRAQYSVFECHLSEDDFQALWGELLDTIDTSTDRIVAYKLDARCARHTLTAGTMVRSSQAVCYLI